MSADIPDYIPDFFSAGQTVKFTRSFQDYRAADGWSYKIYFIGSRDIFSKQATVDEAGNFLVTLMPTDLAVSADDYQYLGRVTNATSGEVYDPDRGWAHVEFDLSTAAAGANLSQAQKDLQNLDALIAKRIAGDVPADYMIAGNRRFLAMPLTGKGSLTEYRGFLAGRVSRQTHPGTLGTTPVKVVFDADGNQVDYPPTWVDVVGSQQP